MADFSQTCVLIADDDDVIREILQESLETMGFEDLLIAADGQETLEILDREKVDLLLLDLAMPRVRGEEVVEVALAQNPSLVIIVITGFATLDKAVDLMKKGIYDLLRKPFTFPSLVRKIEAALNKRDASQTDEEEDKDFGEFTLEDEISRGGSGAVWRARDKASQETVALKILLAGEKATDEQVLRFHREASTIAELRHPNIVSIRRIGVHRGKHYIAMDFIEGMAFSDWVERQAPSLRNVVQVITLAAKALHYAHSREILHRDLKSSNILVDEKLQPHIIDFGLARSIRDSLRITKKSRLHGTIGYIAPERFGDKNRADPRSDIFSLGVILYETVTGKMPYRMITDGQFLPDFTQKPTDPAVLNTSVPRPLADLILDAVAVRLEDRVPSALELSERLEKILDTL